MEESSAPRRKSSLPLAAAVGIGVLNLVLLGVVLGGQAKLRERLDGLEVTSRASVRSMPAGRSAQALKRLQRHVRQVRDWIQAIDRRVQELTYRVQGMEQASESSADAVPKEHFREILSDPFQIDQIYKSMLGPFQNLRLRIADHGETGLLWLTGYELEVVDAETGEPISQEFLCHANLSIENFDRFRKRHVGSSQRAVRLFTLTQGQQSVRLPEGFGLPILASQELSVGTQALNLAQPDANLAVRHRVRIWYRRDGELTSPIQAVYQRGVQGLKALQPDAQHYGLSSEVAKHEEHGPGCDVGQSPHDTNLHEVEDPLGQRFSSHWIVAPGREENRTNVTRWLDLAEDTRIHFIGVHLHPYAETIQLIDLTAKKTLFEADVRLPADRVGLEYVEVYSSPEGIPVHADHEYELLSAYKNPTQRESDAMASMFLYLADPAFQRFTIADRG